MRDCLAGQYITKHPTQTSNRECQDYSPACNDDQYEKNRPTATTNRLCDGLTDCPVSMRFTVCSDRVQAGSYISTAETSTSDRACEPCSSETYSVLTRTRTTASSSTCLDREQ